MGKRIVVCFDGSWETQEAETNVFKLYQALGSTTKDQVRLYYTGVGAEGNALQKFIGGATGEGIIEKIRQGYDDIAKVYKPGDEIFLFGYSRGAFAARCLASMIAEVGLPTRYFDGANPATRGYNKGLSDAIFDAYRHRDRHQPLSQELKDHCVFPAEVAMVGAFDTVAALGIPALFGQIDPFRYGFLDAGWHPNILHSYQALALDERRREFQPLPWLNGPGSGADPYHSMEQVWFPGVHGDVGGGYGESGGNAQNTLGWMLQKAKRLGVTFDDRIAAPYVTQPPEKIGRIHESWAPIWGPPEPRNVPSGATISGFVALERDMGIYQPRKLDFNSAAEVAPNGTLLQKKAVRPKPGEWVPYHAPSDDAARTQGGSLNNGSITLPRQRPVTSPLRANRPT